MASICKRGRYRRNGIQVEIQCTLGEAEGAGKNDCFAGPNGTPLEGTGHPSYRTIRNVSNGRRTPQMSAIDTARHVDVETRIQYGLMVLFGALSLIATVAPIDLLTKAVVVSVLFGFTGGLWISHLVQVLQEAAERKNAATGP